MLSVALVSSNAASSSTLRASFLQSGLVNSVLEWSPRSQPRRQPGSSDPIPDVIVLDLPADTEPFFSFASEFRQLRPAVRIIACSHQEQPDPQTLLAAMRSGVQEFLPKPVNPAALHKVLTRFLRESRGPAARTGQRLIAVLGVKGGVGASTVTVNLAVQIARLTKKKTLLLDLARPVGHIALLLDLQSRFSIRDAAENPDRLDAHFFSGLLSHHKSGVDLLPGASHPEEWNRIDASSVLRIVNLAQTSFDYVLLDCGSHFSPEWAPILHSARSVLLVAEPSVPALWSLERHFNSLTSLGLEPDRARLVINRWRRADDETLKSMEKKLRRPVFARLPNDFRQVNEAITQGLPLFRNHNNSLVHEFKLMAGQLAGVSSQAMGKHSTLFGLFSRPSSR